MDLFLVIVWNVGRFLLFLLGPLLVLMTIKDLWEFVVIHRRPSNARYDEELYDAWEKHMVANAMINITAEAREKMQVTLVGVDYQITPPKAALALKLAVRAKQAEDDPGLMMATVDEWITKAFGKVTAAKVQKRLEDENDDLDFPHIVQLMEAVIEASTVNPTSSS